MLKLPGCCGRKGNTPIEGILGSTPSNNHYNRNHSDDECSKKEGTFFECEYYLTLPFEENCSCGTHAPSKQILIQEYNIMPVQYAITIRRTTNPKSANQDTYLNFMQRYIDKYRVQFRGTFYENTGGLHVHSTVYVPDTFNPILFRTRGWNVKLVAVFNEEGWDNYKQKDVVEQEPPQEYSNQALKKRLFPKIVKIKINRPVNTDESTIDLD